MGRVAYRPIVLPRDAPARSVIPSRAGSGRWLLQKKYRSRRCIGWILAYPITMIRSMPHGPPTLI